MRNVLQSGWDYLPISKVPFPGIIRLTSKKDGSCYFHALLQAFHPEYRSGQSYYQEDIVKNLRNDLAMRIDEPVNIFDPSGPTNYDLLFSDDVREKAKEDPMLNIASLRKALLDGHRFDGVIHKYISDQILKDIYIISDETEDIIPTSGNYYQNRYSIVLFSIQGHYELIGLRINGIIRTHFSPQDPFIQLLKSRLEIVNNLK